MAKEVFFIITIFCYINVNAYIEFEIPRNAFDTDLYENVLDEELCEIQLNYIANNNSMLRATFLDSGLRTPRGILQGNLVDYGNYHECIDISENFEPSVIEGKYCMINVPIVHDLELPTLPKWPEEWPEFPWPELIPKTKQHRQMVRNIKTVQARTKQYNQMFGTDTDMIRVAEDNPLAGQSFRLAVCLPKTCTTKQAIDTLLINTTALGLKFTDEFCRLKNDKPFVPGDYAAMGVFGFIILITILCTGYDIYYTHVLKEDPKKASALGKSFSLYTNTRRLLTFNSAPGALECLDGIRALAMMWVIVGHTYSTQLQAPFYNRSDFFSWMVSFPSLWILAAPITVDTFFLLSGLLIVYTSVGKMSQMGLIRNVHLYYLHRLLRMFPVLAAGVLLQATLFNHLSDGPQWGDIVAHKVHKCRRFWWPTLLHIQNYVTPRNQCIAPTWYLAVDVQLHILSPLILFWVLGKKRSAWIALTLAMLISLTASTVYNYLMEFQPAPVIPSRPDPEDQSTYMQYYYVNTLTRCTPFFVGMLYGYLLNIYKGKQINMPKYFVALGWICAIVVSAGIIYSAYPILQTDWYSPFLDGVINSFSRPGWAACLGWMIFACTHGYGGPINWFLSLRMWKYPARISFAMYIFHYPLMHVVNATSVGPTYFSVSAYFFRFLAHMSTALLVGFVVTVFIDSPFSTLIKLVMGGGPKRTRPEKLVAHEGTNGLNNQAGVVNAAFVPEFDRQISKTKL
ncbi:nose resistant to fluoxetine protein 6-like [Choristoneura fumiferana]|uniref:nose resistant to fluoxetine protein 6-like n=1 Tax=Choristoneura fumiferana TaxID=7141 RepID=UPI003D15BAB2